MLTFTRMPPFSIDIQTVVSIFGGIPVEFQHQGRQYFGLFHQVQGAGSSAVYHLLVNKYYHGRLRLSAYDNQWVFDGKYEDMVAWFSEHVKEYI